MKCKFLMLMACCMLSLPCFAQVNVGPNGTIHARLFGDYYWIPSNHDHDLEGDNGFRIRRIYFTYDQKISSSFSARLRLEMNSAGDFTTDTKLQPSVKDAYLKWKKGTHQIVAGIAPTPSFSFVETVWGYRSIEKTPLDLQKLASSREFGISLKGKPGNKNNLSYHFMFANGNANKAEIDKGKKLLLSLGYALTDHISVQAYGDWNNQPKNRNIYTAQGFVAFQSSQLNIGLLYAHQVQQHTLNGRDLGLDIASLFTHFCLSSRLTGVLRVDHLFEANPAGPNIDYIPFSSRAESTLLIAGADIELHKKIHLIPNIETVLYGKSPLGDTPTRDIIPRLTLYYHF